MQEHVITVGTLDDKEQVAQMFSKYNFLALPRMMDTQACEPELPPVSISMGMNAVRHGRAASEFSNLVMTMPVSVAETISSSSHGIRFFQISTGVDLGRVVWKEIRVSVLCGVCLAIACFAKIIVVDMLLLKSESVTYLVAFVVCATMAVTVCLAKIVGSTLPLLAKKLGFDPAVMASPIITDDAWTSCPCLSISLFATAMLGIG